MAQASSPVNGTKGILTKTSEILEIMKVLREQGDRLAKLQETSNQWQMQHHQNIKRIMLALGRLSDVLRQKTGVDTLDLIPIEDKALMEQLRTTDEEPAREVSLHQAIKKYEGDLHASTLEEMILDIDEQQFHREVKEDSFDIILPLLSEWMQGVDIVKKKIALILLILGSQKFQRVFLAIKNAKHVKRIHQAVSNIPCSELSAVRISLEEANYLRDFLSSASGI